MCVGVCVWRRLGGGVALTSSCDGGGIACVVSWAAATLVVRFRTCLSPVQQYHDIILSIH